MAKKDGKQKAEEFAKALKGKNIPVLTLDNNWYKLFSKKDRTLAHDLEEELNNLLKRQGKLTNETKSIKRLKKNLMDEIVSLVDESDPSGNKLSEKEIEDHKRLIEECNEKIDSYGDELMELPKQITEANLKLMMLTAQYCYDSLQDNAEEITETVKWITDIRIELKKKLVKKQELERKNRNIYIYMHNIFGADVLDLFDLSPDFGDKLFKQEQNIKKDV